MADLIMAEEPRAPTRQHVLLAGDLPIHRIPLSQLLSAYGFSVVVLDRPELVTNFLEHRSHTVMLLLLNLSHPGVGGLDFAHTISTRAAAVGITVAGIYNSMNLTPRHLLKIGIPVAIDAFSLPEEIVDTINRALFKGRDSRRHVRIFVYLPALYRAEGREIACRATSLSLGGVFLQTEAVRAEGSQISFTIQLSANQKVTGGGTVVYALLQQAVGDVVRVSGMGVRFESLDPGGAEHLGEFCRSHLERYLPRGSAEPSEKTPQR